jgi:hypothetical protein
LSREREREKGGGGMREKEEKTETSGNRSPPISGDKAHHWHRNEEEGAAHPTQPSCAPPHVIDACKL